MTDTGSRIAIRVGSWAILVGILAYYGFAAFWLFSAEDLNLGFKILIGIMAGGAGLVFTAVLRRRLIDRKTDPYKDVRI